MPGSGDRCAAHRVGLISDTHGKLDPRVAIAFAEVERILHAGDVGRPDVLWELQTLAPVAAVAGNVDIWEMPGEDLPGLARLEIANTRITLLHIRHELPSDVAATSDVVVFGHSHMPLVEEIDGVLWVNPGSASQARRSAIGRSVAVLELAQDHPPRATIVALNELNGE